MRLTSEAFRKDIRIVKEFPIAKSEGVDIKVAGRVYTDFEGESYLDTVTPDRTLDSETRVYDNNIFRHRILHESKEPVLRTPMEELDEVGRLLETEVLTGSEIKDVEFGKKATAYWSSNWGEEGGPERTGWLESWTVSDMLLAEKAVPRDTKWAIDLEKDSLIYFIENPRHSS